MKLVQMVVFIYLCVYMYKHIYIYTHICVCGCSYIRRHVNS